MERIIYILWEWVSLVVPERSDIDMMWRASNIPEISKYWDMPRVTFREQIEKRYDRWVEEKSQVFTIWHNTDKKTIGWMGFTHKSEEIFISIAEEQYLWKWYGTEAMNLFLKYVFEITNTEVVRLGVIHTNKRGIASYEKSWFQKIGTQKNKCTIMWEKVGMIMMEITKEEYLARKN